MKMRTLFTKVTQFKVFSVLLISLCISLPLQANQDDWVLVDRFKRQLASAEQGKVKAMYAVGKLYERGRGTPRDLTKAAMWYQKAADAGQTSAQSRLGIMYFEGRGVPQDYDKALKLLQTAARDNVPSAQYQIANMYELGTGVSQDLEKAIYWYKKANQYGYYLAEGKVKRLTKLISSVKPAAKSSQKRTTSTVANKSSSPLLTAILNGKWVKRDKAVGYLPSTITKCINESVYALTCISTSQERSTGNEVITYNTESTIVSKGKSKFNITYVNNVLDVESLEVENGDGEVVKASPSRIHKGKQGKERELSCSMTDSSLINCSKKGRNPFQLYSK